MKSEHQMQKAIFEWAKWNEHQHPELALLYAVPNGGQRHKAVAAKLKAEGVKSGVPDICLPVPNGKYSSLYIELKNGTRGKVSDNQAWWLEKLGYYGSLSVVCRDVQETIDVIEAYLREISE